MPRKSKEELKNKILSLLKIENKKEFKSNAKSKEKETSSNKSIEANVSVTSSKVAKASPNTKNIASNSSVAKLADDETASRKSSTKKAAATSSTTSNSATKKSTATKTSVAKKASAKKTTNSKSSSKKSVKKELSTVEYYDLPYRYNETVVKILAQTPNMLFIYWDISDDDRNSYIEKYGENFFNTTKPVLIITNRTMNYSFEVEINDFANSWYLHINDADCDYVVELGRRPIEYNSNTDNFIHITTSNDMQMPNDHILFDKLGKSVFFKNIKNNYIEEKEISSITFIKNLGKVYDIYEFYKEIYNGEINIEDLVAGNIKLNLSSSNSSIFK